MNRRTFLTAGVGVAGLTAGCLDTVLPDEIDERAQPAGVTEAVLTDTGFGHQDTEMVVVDDTVSVRGSEIAYRVENWIATFLRRPDSTTPPAQFAILSTPDVSVLSQQANPIGRMDERTLVEELADEIGLVGDDLEEVGETTVTVGENEARPTLTIYATTAELEGQSYDARVVVGKASIGGDWLVLGTSYPAATDDAALVESLAGGVVHPVDPP